MESLQSYFFTFSTFREQSDPTLGVEYEYFLIDQQFAPMQLEGEHSLYQIIEELGQELSKSGGAYQQIFEQNRVIGLKGADGNVTIEPGGQLEFSGNPVSFQNFSNAHTQHFLAGLHRVLSRHEASILTQGVHPMLDLDQVPLVHKQRYHIMFPHMKQVGTRGQSMMKLTSSVQSSLDYFSQEDLERKFILCNRLSPFLAGLFANSPLLAGSPSGQKSFRYYIWRDTDHSRAGLPKPFLAESFQLNDYIQWALDASPYFLEIDGQFRKVCNTPFRQLLNDAFVQNNMLEAWQQHLAMLFPEVRLKTFIEFRSFDSIPLAFIDVPPLLLGLINYHDSVFEKVWSMVMELQADDYDTFCHAVAKDGMKAEVGSLHLGRFARQLYEIALEFACDAHAKKLIPYFETYTKELRSPADEVLEQYALCHQNIEKYVATCFKHNQKFLQNFNF